MEEIVLYYKQWNFQTKEEVDEHINQMVSFVKRMWPGQKASLVREQVTTSKQQVKLRQVVQFIEMKKVKHFVTYSLQSFAHGQATQTLYMLSRVVGADCKVYFIAEDEQGNDNQVVGMIQRYAKYNREFLERMGKQKVQSARNNGKGVGRPQKLKVGLTEEMVDQYRTGKVTAVKLAGMLRCSSRTVRRKIQEWQRTQMTTDNQR